MEQGHPAKVIYTCHASKLYKCYSAGACPCRLYKINNGGNRERTKAT